MYAYGRKLWNFFVMKRGENNEEIVKINESLKRGKNLHECLNGGNEEDISEG